MPIFPRWTFTMLMTGAMSCALFAQQVALDPSFNAGGSGVNGSITRMVRMPNGHVVIVGPFTSFNGVPRSYAARLSATGELDLGFVPSPTSIPNWWATMSRPSALAVQGDGKVLIGNEDIGTVDGGPEGVPMVVRYNTDGSVDPAFAIGTRTGYSWGAWAIRPDPSTGKVLIGGSIAGYSGLWFGHVVRVLPSGVPEWDFSPSSEYVIYTQCISLLPDGKILVGGFSFTQEHFSVQRLNSNGSIDPTFTVGSTDGTVFAMERLADGKILIAGSFSTYAGATRLKIARLNADGTVDAGFDPPGAAGGVINAMALQPDGKILIGGSFTSYSGVPRSGIARLNADGTLDTGYDTGAGTNGTVTSVAVRPDGQVLIAGTFTSYNGTAANNIALLSLPSPIPPVSVQVKALLEGPYASGGLMNDALRTLPSFPLSEPFTGMGYSAIGYPTGASINAGVLVVTGGNAIVDWVIMELRSSAAPGMIVASRPALIQRDGDVVDLDGAGNVSFPGMAGGSYCIALRPRNHLPVMLAPSAAITGTGSGITVDFTQTGTPIWDNDARTTVFGALVLAAGDINFNGTVQYTGSGNDRDPVLVRAGSTTPNNTVAGYWREDLNMDGTVKYTGSFNDRDRILVNVGPTTPNNTRVATLP